MTKSFESNRSSDPSLASMGFLYEHDAVVPALLLAHMQLWFLHPILNGLTDEQLAKLSKHLSGEAFDVQPGRDADEIKKTIRALPGMDKFLDKEGGLVRWHVQF